MRALGTFGNRVESSRVFEGRRTFAAATRMGGREMGRKKETVFKGNHFPSSLTRYILDCVSLTNSWVLMR